MTQLQSRDLRPDAECACVCIGRVQDWVQCEPCKATSRRDTPPDADLEDAITQACTELSMATTRWEQDMIFTRIGVLHRMRSPDQIARIELARGLRK